MEEYFSSLLSGSLVNWLTLFATIVLGYLGLRKVVNRIRYNSSKKATLSGDGIANVGNNNRITNNSKVNKAGRDVNDSSTNIHIDDISNV